MRFSRLVATEAIMSAATSSCGSRASFDAECHTIDYTTPNAKESRRPWKLRRLTPTTASPNTSARSPVETEEDSPAHAADMVRIDEPLEWTSPEEWYSEKEKEKQEAILAVMRLESTLKTLNHRAKDLHACMASLLERNKKDHNLKMGMNHTDHLRDLKMKAFNIVSCYTPLVQQFLGALGSPETFHPSFESQVDANESQLLDESYVNLM